MKDDVSRLKTRLEQMTNACTRLFQQLFGEMFSSSSINSYVEFKDKFTFIGLQRGRLYKWLTFIVSFISLYLDHILMKEEAIDLQYRKTLMTIHIFAMILCMAYIIVYSVLEKSQHYQFSWIPKAVMLSDMFLTLLTAAILSINSQRFTGNIDAYIINVLAVGLVIPLYPKWVWGIYGFIHVVFVTVLISLNPGGASAVKAFNATTIVMVALVLFTLLYRSNVKRFENEEILKKDRAAFAKLFEINPFPLMIAKCDNGSIYYANRKAISFYEIPEGHFESIRYWDFFKNASDVNIIHSILDKNGVLTDYITEHVTCKGNIKSPAISFELIDCFGEKSILIGIADIGEIKRMEHELSIHASIDVMTGVFNRRVGMELVKKRYEKSKRDNNGFKLCFFDIDNLKMVNDKFGHLEGDSLVITVCKIIKDEINSNDIIFRYGGDEFMILFSDDEDNARIIDSTCNRIAKKFEAMNKAGYKPYPINASMGIFAYQPDMNLELDQIIEKVDRNMYSSKLLKNRQ